MLRIPVDLNRMKNQMKAIMLSRFRLPVSQSVLMMAFSSVMHTSLPAYSSEVRVYGLIDIGMMYQRVNVPDTPIAGDGVDGFQGTLVGLTGGQSASSRWGIRGLERLSDGNRIEFRYEQGIIPTDGRSTSRLRVSTLTWGNNQWGKFIMGRRNSAGNTILDNIDPMDGSYDTASWQSSFGTASVRYSNQVMYESNPWHGFTFAASYSFDISKTIYYLKGNQPAKVPTDGPGVNTYGTMDNARAISTGLRYEKGPWLIGLTYDQINPSLGTSGSIPKESPKAWILAGTYDFSVVKFAMALGQQIDGLIQGGQALSRTGISGGISNTNGDILLLPGARTNAWMFGATVPVGARGSLFGSFQQSRPSGTLIQKGSDDFQNIASIGYTYALSKRTYAYAYYSYATGYLYMNTAIVSTLGTGMVHRF